MALIKCDECGRMISDKSVFCPGCGYPTHLNSQFPGNQEAEPQEKADETPQPPVDTANEQPAVEAPVAEEPVIEIPAAEEAATEEEPVAEETAVEESVAEDAAEEEVYGDEEVYEETEDEAAERHRRNSRGKLIILLSVFAILLVVVIGAYMMPKAPAGETEEEVVDTALVTDTTATAVDTVAEPDTVPDAPVVVPAVRRAVAPTAAEPAPATENTETTSPAPEPTPAPTVPAPSPSTEPTASGE